MPNLKLVFACLLSASVFAADAPPALPPLPEGDTGIAAKYPGDAGIEKDAAVVFYDGFEDASTPADLRKKWDVFSHAKKLPHCWGSRKIMQSPRNSPDTVRRRRALR